MLLPKPKENDLFQYQKWKKDQKNQDNFFLKSNAQTKWPPEKAKPPRLKKRKN